MNLEALAEDIRNFPGVTRKQTISEVINFFPKFSSSKIIASYGEDAAVVEWDERGPAARRRWYHAAADEGEPVLRRLLCRSGQHQDISAMGGIPIAHVGRPLRQGGEGLRPGDEGHGDRCQKFGVPIVGGHTHPDCTYNAIDVAIVGFCDNKDEVIYSHTAQAGDDIIMAMDLDGFYPEGLNYAWDTTSRKESDICRRQMLVMNKIAAKVFYVLARTSATPVPSAHWGCYSRPVARVPRWT